MTKLMCKRWLSLLLALCVCLMLWPAQIAGADGDSSNSVTLNLSASNGGVRIYPSGYSRDSSSSGPTTSFEGDYVITGNVSSDSPLEFYNDSGETVTYNITLQNATISASNTTYTALRINGSTSDSPIILNLYTKGRCTITWPAIRSSIKAPVTINIIDYGGSFLQMIFSNGNLKLYTTDNDYNFVLTVFGNCYSQDYKPMSHVHNYLPVWSQNTSEPVKDGQVSCTLECAVAGCPKDQKSISISNDQIKKEITATCTTAGKGTYTVEYTDNVGVTYSFQKTYTLSALSTSGEHTWDEGEVTKAATETETGIMTYTCTVCGETKTEPISKLPHTHKYDNTWDYDAENHWHECTSGDGEKSDVAAHTFTGWTIVKAPTYSETGIAERSCTVCGYVETQILPQRVYIEEPVSTVSGWRDLSTGTVYYKNGVKVRGWQEIDGETYYFDKSGYLQTGWLELEDSWYYLHPKTGARQYGWQKIGNTWYYLDPKTGMMYNGGLAVIDGETYYFYSWGGMANSWWYLDEGTGDWYFFRGNGAMAKNRWIEWKGVWYYVGADGAMLTSTVTPDGYQVDANGAWIQ